jgi:alpha-L-fucosidase 2
MKTGSRGQLLEWREEYEECQPDHRHISHLFGLFPGDQLDPDITPELFDAAVIALENRLSSGGGHTEWSRAWAACCYARCAQGDNAWEQLTALLRDYATVSLLGVRPPGIFQVDGTLGGAAAVIEMLFQSYHGVLHFLPALPAAWTQATVKGLRGRGGFTVDLTWADYSLTETSIVSHAGTECRIRIGRDQSLRIVEESGAPVETALQDRLLCFDTQPGVRYVCRPVRTAALTAAEK